MSRWALVLGILAAATALGGIIRDGIKHEAFGWDRGASAHQ